ncbi:hypothetical protein D3C75_1348430 [compost metagenome]
MTTIQFSVRKLAEVPLRYPFFIYLIAFIYLDTGIDDRNNTQPHLRKLVHHPFWIRELLGIK